ncbi:MAG: hypothetical protein UZ21_OP11001000345 [Microgenomates bacterium OLB22]|nr:MAG: hypothetical protein UZ21_OP11001000345 [Microgenomates bacterium OLB22]
MGLDLTLILVNEPGGINKVSHYAKNTLRLEREGFYGQFLSSQGDPAKVQARPIPKRLWVGVYTDEGLQMTREDAYGEELMWLYAHELLATLSLCVRNRWNKAIMAFIKAIPPETPIILYWG